MGEYINRKQFLREVPCNNCGLIIMRYRYGTCEKCQKRTKRETDAIRHRWLANGKIGAIKTCQCRPDCDKHFTVKVVHQRYHPDCKAYVKKMKVREGQISVAQQIKEESEARRAFVMKGRKPVVPGSLHKHMDPEQFAKEVNRILKGEC